MIITNRGNDSEVTYNFPPSSVEDFLNKVWTHSLKQDMDKCSNMPSELPFKKRKYLWFKCVFSKLELDFIEVTAREPERYQKMEINIYKKREAVSKIVLHLWGIIADKPAPRGTYNLYNSFFFSDRRG